ncbi:MAG TPA: LysM peptidoglycan-binding domain-containing protein [Methylomusa anaerophila]|uniref:Cell division suppressor protein YneA n=1 Tax=Methylomusa anaerophila TaxID=1930071 RepID=A0A348APT5_9FIRM|nr:LysM peptidoglycan-binding domain-containing protein [Methylomusa anaerophila]BBB93083.1 cell division suppressor protein YneA [Methylomusa anaerophila]HML87084.1 LysM peptidoglycan-binding domain-containing protein [Methylomusa anaerophila]
MKYGRRNQRIQSVFKFVIGILALLFFGSGYSDALAVHNYGFGFNSGSAEYQYRTVQVKFGDSVWTIAGNYISKQDDIRQVVNTIIKINQLNHTAQVFPGQVLKIPVKPSDGFKTVKQNVYNNDSSNDPI